MRSISRNKLGDPAKAYRFNLSLQRRRVGSRRLVGPNGDMLRSVGVQDWLSATESKVVILAGNFSARPDMRDFSVVMIRQLQSRRAPIPWALPGSRAEFGAGTDARNDDISTVDILQHLTFQALRLDEDPRTESGMSLQCARFHRALTERDWMRLLGPAMAGIRSEVYLVVDLSTLSRRLEAPEGFSWSDAFRSLFAELESRSLATRIKVLLLCDRPRELRRHQLDILIPVRREITAVRKRLRR
jgi:hypothetical protein